MKQMTISQELQIEGHKLVALTFNSDRKGPPVILFHGIIASVHFWTPDLLAPFLKLGPCYVLSLPGHYPAVFPRDFSRSSLTADTLARILTCAIRQLVGLTPSILVGHSTGGFVALNIAAHTPEIVRNVISISGFAQGRWTGLLGMYQHLARSGKSGQWLFNALFRLGQVESIYGATARFYVADATKLAAYPNIRQTIYENYKVFGRLSLADIIHYFAVMPEIDICEQLPQIRVPTLILTGDSDPIVPSEQSRLIKRQVSTGKLVVLKKVGHFPFFESPNEYQMALNEWIEANLE